MKPNHKFLRVVLGSVVGAALWAGCASERHVIYEPAGASTYDDQRPALDPQANLSAWHVDTHPERRSGWSMAFPHPSPNATAGDINMSVEEPYLAPPQSR